VRKHPIKGSDGGAEVIRRQETLKRVRETEALIEQEEASGFVGYLGWVYQALLTLGYVLVNPRMRKNWLTV
jgi:hypothetical protein